MWLIVGARWVDSVSKSGLKPGSYTVTIGATLDGVLSKQSRLAFKVASG